MSAGIVERGKRAFEGWQHHNVPRLAAAISYYALFSIAPLLIVVIELLGFVYGNQHAGVRAEIFKEIERSVGSAGAQAIRGIVDATFNQPHQGKIAQAISWVVFVLGAIGLFGGLQDALNTIFEVEPGRHAGIKGMIRDRLAAFGMVLVVAFLLLVLMSVTSLLRLVPAPGGLTGVLDAVVSLLLATVMFAMVFKFLPDADVQWRHVWGGAWLTAVLFVAGQFLVSLYLSHTAVGSAYGAFGSLIVVVVWVNYSASIFLLGAEVARTWFEDEKRQAPAQAAA